MTKDEYHTYLMKSWPPVVTPEWKFAARTLMFDLIDRHVVAAADSAILKKFLDWHPEMAFRRAPHYGVPMEVLAPATVLLIASAPESSYNPSFNPPLNPQR